jgi:NDP-sugar pyrophosphorylase family protein
MTQTNKAYKDVQALADKADNIRARFAQSAEATETEIAELTEKLQQENATAKEIYAGFVIGDFELASYEESKTQADNTRQLLQVVTQKMEDIEVLKQQELTKIYAEYEAVQQDFYTARNKNEAEQVKALKEAKGVYLQQIINISQEGNNSNFLAYKMAEIKADAGLSSGIYHSRHNPYHYNYGHLVGDGLNIGRSELHEVFKQQSKDVNIY